MSENNKNHANRPFAILPKFKNRMILMLLGILVQAFGVALLLKISLGTDPCTALTQGVIHQIPGLTFGVAQVCCHLVTFAVVVLFDRGKIGFGTIANMFGIGFLSDFYTMLLDRFVPEGFFTEPAVRYGLLLPVLMIFLLGAAAYMTADLGMSPYDGVPFIIASHVKRVSFRMVRVLWDSSFMLGGWLLGGSVGAVTVLTAFFLGPVIAWMQRKLAVFLTD